MAGSPGRAIVKHDQEGNVLEVKKTRLKPPPLYKVILLNDDYTPMDFVVVVLQTVFAMSREKASTSVTVHHGGDLSVNTSTGLLERRGESDEVGKES